jgi:hypothetical protein
MKLFDWRSYAVGVTVAILIFGSFMLGYVQSADITTLQGLTGKIGLEDIYWGDGLTGSTFSVPTYGGGSISLTKVPAPAGDTWSVLKGAWYVSNSASITDHGITGTVGAAAFVVNAISATEGNVVFPSKATDYNFGSDVTFPATSTVILDRGVIFSCADSTVDIVFSGGLVSLEENWQGSDCSFDITGVPTLYVSGITEDITGNESRITTLESTVSASNSGLFYSSNHATTLTTADLYYVIADWDGIQAEQGFLTADTAGTITVDAQGAGTYEIKVFGSFTYLASATIHASAHMTRGGTTTDLDAYGCGFERNLGTGADIGSGSLGCLYDLEVADVLDFRVAGSASAQDVTFNHLSFYARRD